MIITVAKILIILPNFCCYVMYFYGTNTNILCPIIFWIPRNMQLMLFMMMMIIVTIIIIFIVTLSEIYKWRH